MKFTEAQIRSDMLFALRLVKNALDNGDLIGDPGKTLKDMTKFINLVNAVALAIYRAEASNEQP